MGEQCASGHGSRVEDRLDEHLATYLETLAAAGYPRSTRDARRRLIVPFIRWVRTTQVTATGIDEEIVEVFLARPVRRHADHGDPERLALRQFLEHLRAIGAAPPGCPRELSPEEALVRRYTDHLRNDRGLCPHSLEVYSPFARAFVAAQRLPERVAAIDAPTVRSYLLDRSRDRSASYVRLLAATLRSFLRFLFFDGATARDLSMAVPPVRQWRHAAVPPFLTADQVEQVIAATDRSSARGRRTLAILLLLARLGLRAGEIVTLELDDIHWGVGEIAVRGKGRLHDRLPLLDDVGRALALYLQDARGCSSSRRVFLRCCAPHVGLSGPSAVGVVARDALRRAGVRPAGRVGAHIFRHSLATKMIQQGASLTEISQLLRHRSLETTRLYAKVEFEALRGVAMPWPGTGEGR